MTIDIQKRMTILISTTGIHGESVLTLDSPNRSIEISVTAILERPFLFRVSTIVSFIPVIAPPIAV